MFEKPTFRSFAQYGTRPQPTYPDCARRPSDRSGPQGADLSAPHCSSARSSGWVDAAGSRRRARFRSRRMRDGRGHTCGLPLLDQLVPEARTYREHAQALWVTSMSDAPVTLGHAAKASLHLIVWCKTCRHQNKTDPADVAALYGPDTPLETWRERLVCSQCGSRDVEILVMGRVARAIDDAPSCASGICLCSAVRSAAAAAVARARNAGVQA